MKASKIIPRITYCGPNMTQAHIIPSMFEVAACRRRCLTYRGRILEISQQVGALHVAPAFSCLEVVDTIYNALMRKGQNDSYVDSFIMSKGHGCLSQYVVLEDLGILNREALLNYCKPGGCLGAHPDYGTPGIDASTGSLGHGLGIAAGMAYADKLQGKDSVVYCLLGDGEMQEGSIWEAIVMAPNLKLDNLVVLVDFNNFQGLGRTSETHPYFEPLAEKLICFGWEAAEVNGHDAQAIYDAISGRKGEKPFLLVCQTIKGKGVSYMENQAIWHYRSPNPTEYQQALEELREIES